MSRRRRAGPVVGAGALALGLLLGTGAPAAGLAAPSGSAEVDGVAVEWGPADVVAPLVSNDPPHLALGRLSLRYDCDAEVLYALVAPIDGVRLQAVDPGEAYLRLGDDPKLVTAADTADGEAPDAAWVDPRDGTAAGLELSTPLTPGPHADLRVHAKVPDDSADGYETLDLDPRYQDLEVTCAVVDPAVASRGGDPGLVVDPGAAADPGDPADPADPADAAVLPASLASTGAPAVGLVTAVGVGLLGAGLALRTRRRVRAGRP